MVVAGAAGPRAHVPLVLLIVAGVAGAIAGRSDQLPPRAPLRRRARGPVVMDATTSPSEDRRRAPALRRARRHHGVRRSLGGRIAGRRAVRRGRVRHARAPLPGVERRRRGHVGRDRHHVRVPVRSVDRRRHRPVQPLAFRRGRRRARGVVERAPVPQPQLIRARASARTVPSADQWSFSRLGDGFSTNGRPVGQSSAAAATPRLARSRYVPFAGCRYTCPSIACRSRRRQGYRGRLRDGTRPVRSRCPTHPSGTGLSHGSPLRSVVQRQRMTSGMRSQPRTVEVGASLMWS
jgi:hypothetical protein